MSSHCKKHLDYAGNGRCPECLAIEISDLQRQLAENELDLQIAIESRDDWKSNYNTLVDNNATLRAENSKLKAELEDSYRSDAEIQKMIEDVQGENVKLREGLRKGEE